MKRILSLLLCACLCLPPIWAQTSTGRYYAPSSYVVTPLYASNSCQAFGSLTCTFGATIPPGAAISGSVIDGNTTATLTSVSDGTENATIEPVYANSTNWVDYAFYFCNTTASVTALTFTWSGGTSNPSPSAIVMYGVASSNCLDGYVKNQSTSSTTAATTVPNTVTPAFATDILVGLGSNNSGRTCTSGTDGQGHTYTMVLNGSALGCVAYLNETSSAASSAAMTLSAGAAWNMELLAFKPAQINLHPGWGSNGRNYSMNSGVGKYYGAQFAATGLFDAHGGTNNVLPTAITLDASTYGTFAGGAGNWSLTSEGTGMIYTNTQATVSLPTTSAISGTGYNGNSGLGIGGTTTALGTGVGVVFASLSGAGVSTSGGFDFYTDCPAALNQDCGSIGGVYSSGGSQYCVAHLLGPGSSVGGSNPTMSVGMEVHGQTGYLSLIRVITGSRYRVNIQCNESGNSFMKVCDIFADPIGNLSEPAAAGAPNDMAIGFSGEEPSTAGYHYYWWNYVWNSGGAFTLTGPCF